MSSLNNDRKKPKLRTRGFCKRLAVYRIIKPIYTNNMATTGISSPLASLESFKDINQKYNFTHLTYPRNVDNIMNQGHYMNFYIYMHSSSNYLSGGKRFFASTNPNKSYTDIGNFGTATTFSKEDINGNIISDFNKQLQNSADVNVGEMILRAHYSKISSGISLYIPDDSLTFSTDVDWSSDTSLTRLEGFPETFSNNSRAAQIGAEAQLGAMSYVDLTDKNNRNSETILKTLSTSLSAIGGAAAGITAGLAAKQVSDFLSSAEARSERWFNPAAAEEFIAGLGGVAVNPQYLFMFKGLGFRKFAFRFVFTPNNSEEADDVKNIVKMFRFHSAPEMAGVTGRFMLAPSVFDIEFNYKGSQNVNIPKIGTCVLTHVMVDYSPRGWSTHTDGMPIHTIMELRFKEVELITKDKIEAGY